MQNRRIPLIGVDIYTPDFLALAKGFGCNGVRANDFQQLRELLTAAARADRPTVVEVLEDAPFLTAAP
jgi:acetolactate synthase-1/2/3 large subunit